MCIDFSWVGSITSSVMFIIGVIVGAAVLAIAYAEFLLWR